MAQITMVAPSLRTVTLFADASLCHRTNAAGWACWAKTAGHPALVDGGALRSTVLQANEAELMALANALAVLRSRGWIPAEIMLQSDCLRALQIIRHGILGTLESRHADGASVPMAGLMWSPTEREAMRHIRATVEGCRLVVRHVKGHSAGGGRNWVNQQCDRLAKRHMKLVRVQYSAR